MIWFLFRLAVGGVVLVFCAQVLVFFGNVLFRAEHPPIGTVQRGVRGTGMVQVYNERTMAGLVEANQVPEAVPYAGEEGAKAATLYKNVQVLGDVSAGEFTRLMVNMTTWLAPEEGCAACHNVADLAEDGLYTKIVARRMLQMVRDINANWTQHVGRTGVTCYTCHRGKLVPPNVWFSDPGPVQAGGLAQMPAGQNRPTAAVGGSALPLDPFTPFLAAAHDVRIQSATALRADNHRSIKQAEWTYALMMHFSQALGVNCDYCHNSRSFADWSSSPPQRETAWHGIRMVRRLNEGYLAPLQPLLPVQRLGPALRDAPKVNCATCHNGVFKPLFGAPAAQAFPELTAAPGP